MTMIIDGSAGVTFPNSTVQASSGVVLQVVTFTSSTGVSTTSTSLVTTGYAVTITPKFATSKIKLEFTGRFSCNSAGTAVGLAFYRGATNLTGTTGYSYRTVGNDGQSMQTPLWVDSPATTSSTTYTLYFSNPLNTALGASINSNNAADFPITFIATEIAA